ncbi:putative late blight resistance protein homolog r1b-8 [Phtheirospermum japonicum]|uniref:Putative late blight resistance protein homolog r1b-8 n=1 Tax=Phtheirospermum japonicum TaxID=374723 RepID=A0A830C9S1_9LAMI|nr:putative late blight resistance protein homolog r1b-8 [Phtheirospermum japonicum]
MRIAEAAYAAEDAIESRIVDTIQLSRPNQTSLQQVIEEMGLIKKVAMSIDTEKAVAPASVPSSSTGPNTTMVGFDDASLKILDELTGDRPDRQVIPIVGMGGIGKTTLARNVYALKLIEEHFDICAWATISQQYDTREILCEVFSQATKTDKEQLSGMSENVLGSKLHKYLFGRRFLVVMDDMWSIDAWDKIQHFFPNNENGSRIMVTTRLSELSSQLNNGYSLQMDFLDEDKSCPVELKKIGKKIVENCRGLPLSIVVVGGLLKKMDATQRRWESIGSNLTSVVNLENDKHCLRLLRLSYNHLPVYLKPCFLYMGVFEEDSEIMVSTLVKLWISEGFLKPMNDDESLETSAIRFLKDLADRNLILIGELGSTGNLKSFEIHDLLRDLCLKEGQKDGFYHVIGERSPRGITSQRRIIIPRNTSKRKVLGDLKSMPHVRSVICEYGKVPQSRNLGLVRTFHAYKFRYYDDKSYNHSLVFKYVNLRHLAIEGRHASSLLSSINLLWNLQTIIVSCSYKSNPIAEIWKMPQFRYIEFVNSFSLPDPPSDERDDDVVIMENLQVLKGVRDFKCCEEVVKRIPNIKILKIKYSELMGTNPDDYYPLSNIKLLRKLESLSVSCTYKFIASPYLHYLAFPHSLKKLSLCMKGDFEWEDMLEKMGSLPHLEKLKLWCGSFGTGKWETVEGQFPCLKYLGLFACFDLEHWTAAEEGGSIFPCLEQIRLVSLKELKNIPCEIGDIPTLQKIWLTGCSQAAAKSAKEIVEAQVELQGEQLPFRVVVNLVEENQELRSLACPNFEVI